MKFKLILRFAVAAMLLAGSSGFSQQLTYKPGGGVQFYDDSWMFRMLGYVQSTFTYHQFSQNDNVQSSFFVRRARVDLIFDFLEKYQIFFEFDGKGSRTELVLAQVDVIFHKSAKLRVGKFITPFSPENLRSSRGLSTVERYSALNSLFLLPALDTQYGLMFFGSFRKLQYYLSIANGNGKASANIKEDNNAKDFQGRLTYQLLKSMIVGGSVNYSKEEKQQLNLVDHTFENYSIANIAGERLGYLADFEFLKNAYLFRGEFFQYHFSNDLSETNQLKQFAGGYLELGYFLFGNLADGLQLISRGETARYYERDVSLKRPSILDSYLLGANWYMDNIFRFQLNFILENANEESGLTNSRFEGKDHNFEVLSMLQIKF